MVLLRPYTKGPGGSLTNRGKGGKERVAETSSTSLPFVERDDQGERKIGGKSSARALKQDEKKEKGGGTARPDRETHAVLKKQGLRDLAQTGGGEGKRVEPVILLIISSKL